MWYLWSECTAQSRVIYIYCLHYKLLACKCISEYRFWDTTLNSMFLLYSFLALYYAGILKGLMSYLPQLLFCLNYNSMRYPIVYGYFVEHICLTMQILFCLLTLTASFQTSWSLVYAWLKSRLFHLICFDSFIQKPFRVLNTNTICGNAFHRKKGQYPKSSHISDMTFVGFLHTIMSYSLHTINPFTAIFKKYIKTKCI